MLIDNAADRQQTPLTEISPAEWRHITRIIVDGAFLCVRPACRTSSRGGGTVTFSVGSGVSSVGLRACFSALRYLRCEATLSAFSESASVRPRNGFLRFDLAMVVRYRTERRLELVPNNIEFGCASESAATRG